MANGNSYDYLLTDAGGTVQKDAGSLTFTDSTVQPFAPGVLGAMQLLGPYTVAYNTASLAAGVAFGFTPAIGDIFTPIVVVTTAFNGTTPLLDIGYTGDTNGYYYAASDSNAALDVSATLATTAFDVAAAVTLNSSAPAVSVSSWARASAADALLVWCSQDGTKGGTAIGGTAGSADLYILHATPTAF